MPLESSITRTILKHLKAIPNSWVLKVAGGPHQRRGVPDILFVCKGKLFVFEVKQPSKKLALAQVREFSRLLGAGITPCVVHDWEGVKTILQSEGCV